MAPEHVGGPIEFERTKGALRIGARTLVPPPTKPGCYQHRAGAWEAKPCLSKEELARLPRPEGSTSLVADSSMGAINQATMTLVFQEFGGVSDSSKGAGVFSLQLNTNGFTGDNGHSDWVQFTHERGWDSDHDVVCIWNIDLSASNYGPSCMNVNVDRGPKRGDSALLATYIGEEGNIVLTAFLPWTNAGNDAAKPDAWNIVTSDAYGLAKHWTSVSGDILGYSLSEARLSQACVTRHFSIGPFPGMTAAAKIEPTTGAVTLESNNMTVINAVNTGSVSCKSGTCHTTLDAVSPPSIAAQCYAPKL